LFISVSKESPSIMNQNLTGILMCGGKSSRMGKDKYALLYNALPLYKPSLTTLEKYCTQILVSSNINFPEFENYTIIEDLVKDIGPMGGIYSCLKMSKSNYNIVLACDMPLVTGDLMSKLIANLKDDYDAVVPEFLGRPEPLYAIYKRSILLSIEECIKKEKYALNYLLSTLNVCYVKVEEDCTEFQNINTPQELR
jgi:molybdopterin-guanine dinucleotide biosynthesis protein A